MFDSVEPSTTLLMGLAVGIWLVLGAYWLRDRHAAWAREFARPKFCPLSVIELVAVPEGQEEAVRSRNADLFTLEEARRMLLLYAPVAAGEIEHLERLLGIDALRRRTTGYLVRLGRRGFHRA